MASPPQSGTIPGSGAPLPRSDQRLAENPRYRVLRERLARQPWLPPEALAQLLGCSENAQVGLGRRLVEAGLITSGELQEAKATKREGADLSQVEILRELGFLGDRGMAMGLALHHGLPYVEITPQGIAPEGVPYLDANSAERWQAAPWRLLGETLWLAAADPARVDLAAAERLAERPVAVAVAPRQGVLATLHHWYGDSRDRGRPAAQGDLDLRGIPPATLEELAARGDTVALVNQLILNALQQRASDIHLVPEERFLRIRHRVDGQLQEVGRLSAGQRAHLVSRIKVVAGMDIAEKRLPQDGGIRARLADRALEIRVSSIPAVQGESLVLRLLNQEQGVVAMPELGFFPEDLERFKRAVTLPYGLILVTGPTGSGKSTTLRAAMQYVQAREERHLLTVEDPVEVRMEGVTQVQVHSAIGYTFATALRHFLRHDPDVIMVGEIRDGETARIAVQAALTGHLVLSTLHTNDAAGAVTRLMDMGVEPYLLSSALAMVIAQRLVRTLCPHCRQPAPISGDQQRILRSLGVDPPPATLWRAPGCGRCGGSGHLGRTVIYEALPFGEALKSHIARGEDTPTLRRAAREMGFQPLMSSGLRKVLEGMVSLEEVAAHLDTMDGFG